MAWLCVQAERQRAELQRELAALGDHVDEANEAARSQVAASAADTYRPVDLDGMGMRRPGQVLYVRHPVSQTETPMSNSAAHLLGFVFAPPIYPSH